MAAGVLPADKLPATTRVLAELIARLLDDRLGTAQGACRIELAFFDGKLKWLQPSPRIKSGELEGFETEPTP